MHLIKNKKQKQNNKNPKRSFFLKQQYTKEVESYISGEYIALSILKSNFNHYIVGCTDAFLCFKKMDILVNEWACLMVLQIIYIDSPFILTSSPDVFYLNK